MKKTVLLLLTFGLAQAMFCQENISRKLDELMSAYNKVNKFNGSVLIARKGKILLEKGYGIKNAQFNTLNDANGIFQIYSITKPFTSTVILQLVEQGKLSLTDKLSKFYPAFPKSDSITIEHLLSHTSGIYDYTRGYEVRNFTEASFIEFISGKPLDFSPGAGWAYSNSGYWLLGFIIEKTTGMEYEEAVQKFIFRPLHMDHSGFDFKNLSDKNKTTGYSIFTGVRKKESIVYDAPGPFAAGAIYSTVEDLYKFHNALQQYTIIKESGLKKAYSPVKNNYGYGWIIGSLEEKQVVSHSGGAAGYRSNLLRIPEEDICIVLLNNNENAMVELITKNLLNILFDKPYKIPAEIKLSTTVLQQFAGTFAVEPKFNMYFSVQDGRLTAQASMQPKTVVLAEKENYFYAEEANGFLEFLRDSTGNYNELVIHQGGQQLKGKRVHATWGLTGTATSKGWDEAIPDIQLQEDTVKKGLWVIKNINLKSGEFVFRLNNDWGYHYGDNGSDKALDMYGKDIAVEAGIYDIILDLTDTLAPIYSIVQKS